jgi:nitroreductase
MEVAEAIRLKRAIREFDGRPLPDEAVRTILWAGRRAQSSKNSQPWYFLAIRDRATLESLSLLGNYAAHLAGAALGVAILTTDPAARFSILFDAGQAAAYMQLAAWELGIGSCLATIYDPDATRQLLAFPPELHLRIAISFGYPADPRLLTSPPRPTGRRPLSEAVRFDRWTEHA